MARLSLSLLVLAVSRAATADETPCDGVHSLFHPLPDVCLEGIDTDRPHQTDTPHVIAAGHAQFESAVVSLPIGSVSGRADNHLVLLDDSYKFGLASRVELDVAFKHADYDLDAKKLAPPGPFSARVKINLVDEHHGVPAITLVPWGFFPVSPAETLRGGGYLFWGWEIGKHFELEMNAGLLFSAKPKPPAVIVLATAMTYTIVGNFRVFVDVYATGWDVAFGTGALWAFARDMQIDLGTYIGLNGDEPVATPFLGFSIRR